jgi:hypothetical protein
VISHAGRRLRDFLVETNGQAFVEAVRIKGSPANGDVRLAILPMEAKTSWILAGSEN